MKRRPVGYIVQQRGLSEYAEVVDTKREAIFLARECLWWSTSVTIRPLYAGAPIKWISQRQLKRRAGPAKSSIVK